MPKAISLLLLTLVSSAGLAAEQPRFKLWTHWTDRFTDGSCVQIPNNSYRCSFVTSVELIPQKTDGLDLVSRHPTVEQVQDEARPQVKRTAYDQHFITVLSEGEITRLIAKVEAALKRADHPLRVGIQADIQEEFKKKRFTDDQVEKAAKVVENRLVQRFESRFSELAKEIERLRAKVPTSGGQTRGVNDRADR